MTNVEGRVIQLELALKAALARLAAAETRLAAAEQLGRSSQGIAYNWGGGGGGDDTFHCLAIPAIPAGLSGTADVYHLVGGTSVRVAVGATIWNLYGSATTAGRFCTLGVNLDGSYTILAQSCA